MEDHDGESQWRVAMDHCDAMNDCDGYLQQSFSLENHDGESRWQNSTECGRVAR